MTNAINSAVSGMLSRSRELDLTSNNLANLGTPGFKRDKLISSDFGNHLIYKMTSTGAEELGGANYGSKLDSVYTYDVQGAPEYTNRLLDFAINGKGYFTLQRPDGSAAYTRGGRFNIDGEGYLTDASGSYVMGQNGRILVGSSQISVTAEGGVYSGGVYADRLAMVGADGTETLNKLSDGALVGNPSQPFTGSIIQGALEQSGVDLTQEMSNMIEASRAFQTCSQFVKMLDQIMQKTVTEIGRV